jgi:Flp pilus assembly protein CpaB
MKKSVIIILGLALLAGGLTISLLTFYVNPQTVVIARHDLAAGTRLTADLLEESRLPKGAIPEGALSAVDQAVGLVLTADRVSGDVITSYVAGDSTAAAGIPAQLSPDNVAIAVDVDQATGLAGIVRSGQRVSVIAILDPQAIQRELSNNLVPAYLPTEVAQLPEAGAAGAVQPTPTPTPTPQPPLSPVASITIKGLRVLVVPQSFRYEELPTTSGEAELFASARTSQVAQTGSVILLEAPLAPVQIAQGYSVSPAELLALLNKVATIHLALEPSDGLTIEVASLEPVDLAKLYEHITGYELNP